MILICFFVKKVKNLYVIYKNYIQTYSSTIFTINYKDE
jgi:hypothetical protein